jgi:hypothetical protein
MTLTMDRTATLRFARRIRDISTGCYDLGAAERMRLLADEMERDAEVKPGLDPNPDGCADNSPDTGE